MNNLEEFNAWCAAKKAGIDTPQREAILKPKKKNDTSLKNQEGELWRPAVGFESQYMVSNMGRVKSLAYTSLTSGTRKKDYILSTGHKPYGLCVTFRVNGKPVNQTLHMLVARAWVDKPEGALRVRPINGDPEDARAVNLRWE
jgi:hypothetical protein